MRLQLRELLMEMKCTNLKRIKTFFICFFILCTAKEKTHQQAYRCTQDTHTRAHIHTQARTHARTHAHTQTYKGAGSTGGHPSYGKHSWTINLISIMVTHEWNAAPCFMMANWCWYTPNVALINIGRNRELTQIWYISLLMKRSNCGH